MQQGLLHNPIMPRSSSKLTVWSGNTSSAINVDLSGVGCGWFEAKVGGQQAVFFVPDNEDIATIAGSRFAESGSSYYQKYYVEVTYTASTKTLTIQGRWTRNAEAATNIYASYVTEIKKIL